MKKRTFIILFVLLLTAFSSVSALAATSNVSRVTDNAGLLSSSQKSDLENALKNASSKGDMDVVIITTDSIPESYDAFGNDASEKYADDLYDSNGYSKDGILLFICSTTRDYAISTKGRGIEVFNDSQLSSLENAILPYLKNNDYNGAFNEFADKVASAKDFKFGMWAAIAAGIGALVGAIRSGSLKSQLKSVYSKDEAKDYIKKGSFVLNKKFDVPTYVTVERTLVKSSESGTSTHVSSSGETHGGTHGKF
ncbi:MAG: TPM domain-containing protein [Lachnospiraceae bacterium]|nr:TPM domain-containing protein [Lachnospiraceae bacterium]